MTTYHYPVNTLHSTVLGWTATSQTGRSLWESLDWSIAWEDGGQHLMNPDGGAYLHVGAPDGARYRVRCLHRIGSKWRGGIVSDVRVEQVDGAWFWLVDVHTPTPGAE